MAALVQERDESALRGRDGQRHMEITDANVRKIPLAHPPLTSCTVHFAFLLLGAILICFNCDAFVRRSKV